MKPVFEQYCDMVIIFNGHWPLYRDFRDQEAHGYWRMDDDKVIGSGPWIDPRDRRHATGHRYTKEGQGEYPFEYYQEYLKSYSSCKVITGVGYDFGAAQHNLSRLVELGYYGSFFFVPGTDEEMEKFITDIQEWQER